jgi:hypothetical protein
VNLGDVFLLVKTPDPAMAEFKKSWEMPTTVDTNAFGRVGIDPDRIPFYQFYGAGVCRRSALRLILAESSLSYGILEDGIVLTIKANADSYGNANSEKPTVARLCHCALEIAVKTALLLALLSDRAVTVRQAAAWALANLELPVETATQSLEAATRDTDRDVASRAVSAP